MSSSNFLDYLLSALVFLTCICFCCSTRAHPLVKPISTTFSHTEVCVADHTVHQGSGHGTSASFWKQPIISLPSPCIDSCLSTELLLSCQSLNAPQTSKVAWKLSESYFELYTELINQVLIHFKINTHTLNWETVQRWKGNLMAVIL